jgi:hypothetical protein
MELDEAATKLLGEVEAAVAAESSLRALLASAELALEGAREEAIGLRERVALASAARAEAERRFAEAAVGLKKRGVP